MSDLQRCPDLSDQVGVRLLDILVFVLKTVYFHLCFPSKSDTADAFLSSQKLEK